MWTDDQIIELAEGLGIMGCKPRPRPVYQEENGTIRFETPPGLTYFGAKVLAFGRGLLEIEEKRKKKVNFEKMLDQPHDP